MKKPTTSEIVPHCSYIPTNHLSGEKWKERTGTANFSMISNVFSISPFLSFLSFTRAMPHYGWADVVGDSTQLLSIQPQQKPPGAFPNNKLDASAEEDSPPDENLPGWLGFFQALNILLKDYVGWFHKSHSSVHCFILLCFCSFHFFDPVIEIIQWNKLFPFLCDKVGVQNRTYCMSPQLMRISGWSTIQVTKRCISREPRYILFQLKGMV